MAVVAPKFEVIRPTYEQEWSSLVIRPDRRAEVQETAAAINKGKPVYLKIEKTTGVPWWFIGLIHLRESTLDFTKWLGNGDPLNKVSVHVPAGYGPFGSFEEGAVKALEIKGYKDAKDWGIARVAFRFEGYNGFGPRVKRKILPSYLYGGSNHYEKGKYTSDYIDEARSGWDPNHIDKQLGVLVVLKMMMTLDSSIKFGVTSSSPATPAIVDPDDELAPGILWVQWGLNKLGAKPPLDEDGVMGTETMDVIKQFQQENGLPATGTPDERTFDEVEKHLKPLLAKTEKPSPGDLTQPKPTTQPHPQRPLSLLEQVRGTFRRLFGG